ncbi:Ig-like domain-containing protein [Celeribacter sp. PS-C1]|uniref:Ig-like domain-containing protein n=1 Tax=Celeribacter sp. PS-C1 TaxID=2820813 RepID=UPI001CA59DC1|nr:Ig-like domain-containing protein [Celeribacter sp. PS-C1]MBW6416905.1 hypothetical protein [Celeribacter sp. PS-C1]
MTARSFLKHISRALIALCFVTALSEPAKAQATDTTPPRIQSITRYDPSDEYTNDTELTWEITFTEDISDINLADFNVFTSLSGLAITFYTASRVSPNAYRYMVRFSYPETNGTRSVWLAPRSTATITDTAGNAMTDFTVIGATERYYIDNVAPTLSITSSSSFPTNNSVIPLTFTFSEIVTGFDVSDLTLSSGTGSFSNFSGSGDTYTADLTLSSAGAFQVAVADAAAVDRASNPGTGATLDGTRDVTAPSAVLSAIPPEVNGPFNVTVTFDEDISGIAFADLVVTNGRVSYGTRLSDREFRLTIIPDADGTVTVSVPAGATTDAAGNGNTASNTVSTMADVTRPTVTLDMPSGLVNAPFTLTMTFSEEVTGVSLGNIAVSNGTASNLQQTSATVYTATITPDTDGTVTVNFPENGVTDTAGLGNEAATAATNTADLTDPAPTLTATPDFPGTPYTVTISFNEDVTGLELSDFSTTNVDLSSLSGSGDSYTLQATGTDFAQSIQLRAGTVLDDAGNGNVASNIISVVPDGVAPSLTISGVPGTITRGETFVATFTFTETVTGFEASDIALTNATMGALTGSGSVYSATITPDDRGDVTVSVADGAARDMTGEPSVAASAVAQLDTSADQSEAIANFLQARARSLIQNQPDVSRFVTGQNGGNASVSVSRGGGEFALSSRGNGPLWMAVSGSWSDSDTEEMSYGLASLGYHMELSSGTIIGAMVQYDMAEQEDTQGTKVEGTGWLVGPYFASQIGDHPFFVDGRLLFGETDNDITLSSGQTGSFTGDRMLASLGAQGRVEMDKGWTLIPNLTLSHVSDSQNAYVSDGTAIPEQKVTLTELAAGLDFEVPILVPQGDLMLDFGISGIYSHTKGSGAASAYILEEEGHRGRVDVGLSYDKGNGLRTSGAAFVDGLGGDTDVSSYGLSFEVAFTF